MEIALHFLRKGNRDLQDSRTFEIPACRVFMLAEYSEVHAALFEENKEAVFFRTKEELLQKVIYYKSESARRAAIAEAGYQRCFSGGYDHYHTLQRVLKTINKEDSGNHNING
jgi:spore maturation protein CgeB